MNYSLINKVDIVNGPGVRVSLFVSGCNKHCKNCYNQEAQNFDNGEPFNQEVSKTILELVAKTHCSGLSILGGEPLDQNADGLITLIELVRDVHKLGKTVWLWTGYEWQNVFNKTVTDPKACNMRPYLQQTLLLEVDVVVDGPFIEDYKDLSLVFRGSSNQNIIDVKETLTNGRVVLTKYMNQLLIR